MAEHRRASGVVLTIPDGIAVGDIAGAAAPPPPPAGHRRRRTAGAAAAAPAADPLIQALNAEDMELLDAFSLTPTAPAPAVPRRAGRLAGAPTQVRVDVGGEEQAALLVEQDGVYAWQLPSGEEAVPPAAVRRGAGTAPPRRLVFDLEPPVGPAPALPGRRSRGPVVDALVGKVRAWVFKWVARKALGGAVAILERNVRPGLVVMDGDDPAAWRHLDSLDAGRLPTDRLPRILLFVHGTFSTTRGSFGALAASDWGRAFLADARRAYDVVLGYDHATLGESPLANANDLLRRIRPALSATGTRIDAVAFSRGALVLRSLIEHLLPMSQLRVRVGRAVFVGGTNGGTQLANPENWKRLADLYTNLAVAASRALAFLSAPIAGTVLRETVATLGALVRHLAEEAIDGGAVPGLAAMEPDGAFVRDINGIQPGQPMAADAFYYVIRSDFDVALLARGDVKTEFPQRLAQWVLDAFADQLMREPNDLVVHVRSMAQIDPDAGSFVRDRFDFGRNPHVYHTIYFTRPEVVVALYEWLELPGTPEALARRGTRVRAAARASGTPLPASADTNLLVVKAETPVAEVVEKIRSEDPGFVVVDRFDGTYWYAFEPGEIVRRAELPGTAAGSLLEDALQGDEGFRLGEDRVSKRRDVVTSAETPGGPTDVVTTGRTILFSGKDPVGVVAGPSEMVPSKDLLAAHAGPWSTSFLRRALPRIDHPVSGEMHAPLDTGMGSAGGAGGSTMTFPVDDGEKPARGTTPPRRRRSGGGAYSRTYAPSAAPPPETPPAPATGTCYVGATTSTPIGKGEEVPLSVTLSREEIVLAAGRASATAAATIDYSRRLVVQVVAIRNLEVVGDDRVVLDSAQITPRAFVEFTIRGTTPGEGEVWAILRQGPVSVATVVLKPEIVAAPSNAKRRIDASKEGAAADPAGDPYPLLQIFESWNGSELRYHFVLTLPDGTPVSAFSEPIRGSRDDYVDAVYKEIEERWVASGDDVALFEQEMREYGGQLLDELMPDAIVKRLWDLRDTLRSIHVVSAEPFIPWEIVHLKPPRPVGGQPQALPSDLHFLAQKGLVRWLHNHDLAPRLRVRPGKAWYAIPDYPYPGWELPAAQDEIPFLVSAFGAQPAPAAGTPAPHGGALRALFRRAGDVDLFHFSGHGVAEGTGPTRARILLLGPVKDAQGRDGPESFASTAVEGVGTLVGTDGTRPIAFLNACQVGRQGWNLTSIGGFAQAFLRVGAGAFVGTLWSVGDEPAATFGKAFYQALIDGESLANAAVTGRNAAKDAGEATWLAYVVYGHPHAKLTRR